MTRSKTLHCVFERDKGMREVDVNEIIKNIKEMCIEANHFLSKDMKEVYDAPPCQTRNHRTGASHRLSGRNQRTFPNGRQGKKRPVVY